jgi:hypothetical protein
MVAVFVPRDAVGVKVITKLVTAPAFKVVPSAVAENIDALVPVIEIVEVNVNAVFPNEKIL